MNARSHAALRYVAVIVFALIGATPALAEGPAAAATAIRHKVVVQMSDGDPAKWNLALNNVNNIQADLGAANVDVEVVAYGPGIGMLKAGSPVATRVANAVSTGVTMAACLNTMKGQNLVQEDMQSGMTYVVAGVVELMVRQREGWSYIRP